MQKSAANQNGQVLIEILLAILIAVAIIGAVSNLLFANLKSGKISGAKNVALSLAQEGLEAMETIRDNDWHNIYLPPDGNGNSTDKGNDFPYYLHSDDSSWSLSNNIINRDITIDGTVYLRTIYIYNVSRGIEGDIVETGGMEDPSTQKIQVVVSSNESSDVALSNYFTRWKNETFIQTDWSGGSGQAGPLIWNSVINQYSLDDGNIDVSDPAGSIKLK